MTELIEHKVDPLQGHYGITAETGLLGMAGAQLGEPAAAPPVPETDKDPR